MFDFRKINQRVRRKLFPIPKIKDIRINLEDFAHVSPLDLNMGYYNIDFQPGYKQLCTILIPRVKYEFQKLPMGVYNSPDISQEKISSTLKGFIMVHANINDVIVITKD